VLSHRLLPAALVGAIAVLSLESLSLKYAIAEPLEVMSGDFSGEVVTIFLDQATVQSWLPGGLSVAEDCPFESHPVLILYGTQRNLARTKRIRRYLPWAERYLETFVAVPYLRVDNSRCDEHVFYFARVYLDNLRATEMGIERYGWEKIYTRLSDSQRDHSIWNPQGQLVFTASGTPSPARPIEPGNPSVETIQEMLSQTLVLKHRGRFDRYSFNLHFASARVQAVDARVRINRGFMPGLVTMEGDVAGIDRQPFGAFQIRCHFTKRPK
jgi:hypothetical protein